MKKVLCGIAALAVGLLLASCQPEVVDVSETSEIWCSCRELSKMKFHFDEDDEITIHITDMHPDFGFFKQKANELPKFKLDISECTEMWTLHDQLSGISNMTSISLPESLTDVDANSFTNCKGLKEVIAPLAVYNEAHGFVCFRDYENEGMTLRLTGRGEMLKDYHFDAFEKLVIDEGITGTKITINSEVLKEIEFPSTLIEMYPSVIGGCSNLETVTLKEGLEKIGRQTLIKCEKLKSLKIPGSVKSMDNELFMDSPFLEKVVFCEGVEEIPVRCFMNCSSLNSVVIPESVNIIGEKAFEACDSLESITFADPSDWYSKIKKEYVDVTDFKGNMDLINDGLVKKSR